MIITYNHEKFVAQALNSILTQRVNFDYENVVGEDHSKDGTREILMDFHQRHPQRIVPLLRDKNMGAVPNTGATLAACRGTYIAPLEGDDYWTDEHTLQKQIDFLDSHPGSTMAVYRMHAGGIWTSRPTMSRIREITGHARRLDKHFDFKYLNIIRPTLARSYLDLAMWKRQKGNELDTGTYTFSMCPPWRTGKAGVVR
jgi:glycosyltransferase involved in cell wall biosynthesis